MLRRTPGGRILRLRIASDDPRPVYRQIHAELRAAILDGRLAPRSLLPSTRGLANDLGVSRSTVVMAYEQLRAEGFIDATAGSATRVSATAPVARAPHERSMISRRTTRDGPDPIPGTDTPSSSPAGHAVRAARTHGVSKRMQRQAALRVDARIRAPRPIRAFRCGNPALDLFPLATWGRILARRWRSARPAQLGYGDPFGLLELREAIADHLVAARGVQCTAEQVMITAGSQQALDLAARVLLDPGDEVWVEDPGFPGLRGLLLGHGMRMADVPVDDEGMRVHHGVATAPHARAAFVTPSSHLPLGVTLSLARRQVLLDWAEASGAWIVEDDYASELRWTSPLAPLHALDRSGRVIFCGTFSKVLLPALRLGYLVVPPELARAFAVARTYADYHSPFLEQATLATFIRDGHLDRHVRRMRVVHDARQRHLVDAIERRLGGRVRVGAHDGALDLVLWLERDDDAEAVVREGAALGVDLLTIRYFAASHPVAPGLLLNFASVREREIDDGVERLARAIERVDARRLAPISARAETRSVRREGSEPLAGLPRS